MNGRVVSSISGRIIQNDTLYARNSVPELTEKMNIRVLQRLGGPNRVLVNNDPSYQVSFLWVIILIGILSDILSLSISTSFWYYCTNQPGQVSSVALEVLLHPPSPGHASFDGGIGVKLPQVDDRDTTIRLSSLPDNVKTSLLFAYSSRVQYYTSGNSVVQRTKYG